LIGGDIHRPKINGIVVDLDGIELLGIFHQFLG
jgi:hypothetical protein